MEFFIIVVLVVGAIAAWRYRVRLLAKILGQPEQRIQRAIDRRKDGRCARSSAQSRLGGRKVRVNGGIACSTDTGEPTDPPLTSGDGSRDWTRTSNRPINSRMLCQLSYAGSTCEVTRLAGAGIG